MSAKHYENFPVASWLCPAALRSAVMAIYQFARTADDIADEGRAAAADRLADLAAFRADLEAAGRGAEASERWPAVFGPLASAIARHRLPLDLLGALLGAFEQDVVKWRYADRFELLDYCHRSAAPVGRLLLHLYGVDDERLRAQSDAVCIALQLANFWQDLGVDTRRGRLYLPETDCRRHGVDPGDVLAGRDSAAVHALVVDAVSWARGLMLSGAPLVHALHGREGFELRLVVQGGLRILERIDLLDGATLLARPVIGKRDVPVLAWRALLMREGVPTAAPRGRVA